MSPHPPGVFQIISRYNCVVGLQTCAGSYVEFCITWAEGEEVMQPVDVVGAVSHRGNEVAVRHPPVQAELRMQQRSSQQPVHMHKTMHQLCKV